MVGRQRRRALKSIFTIFILLGLFQFFQYLPNVHANLGWSSATLIDSSLSLDTLPSALQASNGTMWLAWQSNRNDPATGRTDIIYKTYTNGAWSGDHNLTSSGWNSGPSLVQLSNATILAFWSIKSGTSFLVYSSLTNGRSWTAPVQITSTTYNDTLPSASVGRDGTIYLVWTRVNSTNPSVFIKQLYYKTWKNGSWSPETQLTTDSNQNQYSTVMVGKDGIVRLVWSKSAGSIFQLYSKYYNGASWTAEKQNVTSSSADVRPSLMQDRNGTLWLVWARLIVVSSLVQYYILFGKYSYNMGNSWSNEIQLTPTPGSTVYDSYMPNAVQTGFSVKSIWIFYSSNFNIKSSYNIFAIMSTPISGVHDLIVSGLTASSNLGTTWLYQGGLMSLGQNAIVTVTVSIANIGDFTERPVITLTVTNKTTVYTGTESSSYIGFGNTMNLYFYWNTTTATPARYGLSVSISVLPGETLGNMGDNNYSLKNQIHILPVGDFDQDGSVTMTDLSVFFYNYGLAVGSNHNGFIVPASLDLHGTGVVDIVDIGIASNNYDTFT